MKKVILISIVFEACIFTSLTVCGIILYRMIKSFITGDTLDFKNQIQLYIMAMLFLFMSKVELNEVNLWLYQNLNAVYLGLSPYYTTFLKLKEELL